MTYADNVNDETVWQRILDYVREERGDRELDRFDHVTGHRIGRAALSIAEAENLPVAIAVRRGRQLVFHAALPGTTAEHDDWIRRKENTAMEFEIPSLEFAARQAVARRDPDWLDPLEYAVAGGAVPVFVNGAIVGTVTVSGIIDTTSGDHDLAMRAVRIAKVS